MFETTVTLQGYVGNKVKLRRAGDALAGSFRVACTPRRFHKGTGAWFDAETQWFTVNVWRALAEHCELSLETGDAVVVHGRLSARKYVNANNVEVSTFEIDATFVGHDLNRGTSRFAKTVRPEQPEQPAAQVPAQPMESPAA